MTPSMQEYEAIESLKAEYLADGYDTTTTSDIARQNPAFIRYIPDLLLKKDGRYLAIEVKAKKSARQVASLEELKREIETLPKWRFEYFFLDQMNRSNGISSVSREKIEDEIKNIEEMRGARQYSGAFLNAWATLEAAARFKHPRIFRRPQSPARITTTLATRGEIDPKEADKLREMQEKRNIFIHGGLNVKIEPDDSKFLISVVKKLIR